MEWTPPLPTRCAPPRGWEIRVRFGYGRGCGSDYLLDVILGHSRFLLSHVRRCSAGRCGVPCPYSAGASGGSSAGVLGRAAG